MFGVRDHAAGRHARLLRTASQIALLAMAAIAAAPAARADDAAKVVARVNELERRKPVQFEIPAQPLSSAIVAFSRTADVDLVFDGPIPADLTTRGASGLMTPAEALARLLDGVDLSATMTGPRTVTLLRTQAGGAPDTVELREINVQGGAGGRGVETATGPVRGYVATRSATATKSDTPILETPRSLSVVTADEMQGRAAIQNLADTLAYTPGFFSNTSANTRTNDVGLLRGFAVFESLYLDGLALPNGLDRAQPQVELYGVERVEVLKGPASALYGLASPGGTINMVSKRPTFDPIREIRVQGGSFDHFQGAFDFSDKVDAGGTLAYRVVGLAQDSGTQVRGLDDNRFYIAPSVTWRPDDDTELTVLAHYRRTRGGDFNNPIPIELAKKVSPHLNTGDPTFEKNDHDQGAIGYEFRRRLNDTFQLFSNGRYFRLDVDHRGVYGQALSSDPDAPPGTILRTVYLLKEKVDAYTFDNRLQADFETGPLTHKVFLGVDYRRQDADNKNGYFYGGGPDFNVFNPIYGVKFPKFKYNSAALRGIEQTGVYAQEELKFDRFTLSFGGRHDWASTSTELTASDYNTKSNDKAFSGNVGLSYRFANGVAPYVSFAQSFAPAPSSVREAKKPFKPTRGEQYEAGVKYQPTGWNALFTAAVFDLKEKNRLGSDFSDPTCFICQKQVGEVRIRGFEFEAKTTQRNLDLVASYAYLDSEVTKSEDKSLGKALPQVPRHTAGLWANYRFTAEPLAGLNAGGGVRRIGAYYGDDREKVRLPAVSLVDLTAGYDFGQAAPRLRGLRFDLNVTNVANRKFLDCDPYGCTYGKLRTALATMSYRW